VTVGACLIAALLLLVSGYVGYFGMLLILAGSAGINLLEWPAHVQRDEPPPPSGTELPPS
jgi:hypothetical protein